jgi:hypothetical protein
LAGSIGGGGDRVFAFTQNNGWFSEVNIGDIAGGLVGDRLG